MMMMMMTMKKKSKSVFQKSGGEGTGAFFVHSNANLSVTSGVMLT